MAATFEGKSKDEFFSGAAQRQKRSNAYATYTPAPKREEGKQPPASYSSPAKKPDAPKPVAVAAKPTPAVAKPQSKPAATVSTPAKPTTLVISPPKRHKTVAEQRAEIQDEWKRGTEKQEQIKQAKRELQESRGPVVRASEAIGNEVGYAVKSGLGRLWKDAKRTYRYVGGDSAKYTAAEKRIKELESSK